MNGQLFSEENYFCVDRSKLAVVGIGIESVCGVDQFSQNIFRYIILSIWKHQALYTAIYFIANPPMSFFPFCHLCVCMTGPIFLSLPQIAHALSP